MDICYGCMYHFGSNPELEQRMKEEHEQNDAIQTVCTPMSVNSCDTKNVDSDFSHPKENTQIQQGEQEEDTHPLTVRFEVRHGDALNRTWSVEATLPLTLRRDASLPLIEEARQ